MLKKQNRLKKRKEFNYIYKKGTITHAADFFVHYTRATRPYAQIGVAVSKQVGNSVVRSRVKRIISEACRLNIAKFAVKNYVITAKPSAKEKKMQDIEKQLLFLLKKHNLLAENNANTQNNQFTHPHSAQPHMQQNNAQPNILHKKFNLHPQPKSAKSNPKGQNSKDGGDV